MYTLDVFSNLEAQLATEPLSGSQIMLSHT